MNCAFQPAVPGARLQKRLRTGQSTSISRVVARSGPPGKRLALHVGETTIQLPFDEDKGKAMDAAISKLLQTFSDKQKAERPKRWDLMEVRFKGEEAGSDIEFFEAMCNPNAYPSAFDAKVLITIKSRAGVSIMTEARLSAFKADLDAFVRS